MCPALAPAHLLPRRREAKNPGGKNPIIAGVYIERLVISNIGEVASPSAKKNQDAVGRKRGTGRFRMAYSVIYLPARDAYQLFLFTIA